MYFVLGKAGHVGRTQNISDVVAIQVDELGQRLLFRTHHRTIVLSQINY